MSKNVVEPEKLQAIWRMRVACWISKVTRTKAHARARAPTPTHTYARTDIHSAKRLSVTLYVRTLSVLYCLQIRMAKNSFALSQTSFRHNTTLCT